MANQCPICNKKIGFWLGRFAQVDGETREVCGADCFQEAKKRAGPNKEARELHHAQAEEANRKFALAKQEKFKQDLSSIIVVTSDHIPAMKVVSTLGLARGSTVRAKHMGRDIGASLKNIVGGEIVGYTEMMAEAREEALYRMKEDAVRLGANGVTAFRFASATIDVGSAEVTAYGTAVTVEKDGV